MKPVKHSVYRLFLALEFGLNRPVGQIPHPARKTEASCLIPGRGPEKDTLHPALDNGMKPPVRHSSINLALLCLHHLGELLFAKHRYPHLPGLFQLAARLFAADQMGDLAAERR